MAPHDGACQTPVLFNPSSSRNSTKHFPSVHSGKRNYTTEWDLIIRMPWTWALTRIARKVAHLLRIWRTPEFPLSHFAAPCRAQLRAHISTSAVLRTNSDILNPINPCCRIRPRHGWLNQALYPTPDPASQLIPRSTV